MVGTGSLNLPLKCSFMILMTSTPWLKRKLWLWPAVRIPKMNSTVYKR